MVRISIEEITRNRILPVITINRLEDAEPLAKALKKAGMKVLEITLRTEISMAAVELLCHDPDLTIGVGSVTQISQLERAKSFGAKFAVSPGILEKLVVAAAEFEMSYIPGVSTPTEIMQGLDCGLSTFKFFPSEILGGVPAIRALSGPFPTVTFIPTGGINLENAEIYLKQENVIAVGGSWMVTSELMESGNFPRISILAENAIKTLAVRDES